jgi:hypothetical protein
VVRVPERPLEHEAEKWVSEKIMLKQEDKLPSDPEGGDVAAFLLLLPG